MAQPQLPEGFELDKPAQGEGLPDGFVIDGPEQDDGFFGASIIEPAATIASGMASTIAGGLSGVGVLPYAPAGVGADVVNYVKEAGTFQPRTKAGQEGLEFAGNAVQGAVDLANYPLSGIGGLMEVLSGQGIDQAAETIRNIQEKGVGKTFGNRIFEETGSPLAATIAETSPDAILEMTGLGAGARVGGMAKRATGAKTNKLQSALDEIKETINTGKATDEGVADVAEIINKGTPEQIAAIIDADPKFYQAADELGISVEPLAGFASKNPQYRDVEGALRKIPGSILEPQAIDFIKETSKAADNLIETYGGTKDKAQLGLDYKRDALSVIDDLADQADTTYEMLKEIIPEGNRFEAPNTVAFLKDMAIKEKIPPKFAKILSDLTPKQKKIKGVRTVNPATGKVTTRDTMQTKLPTLAKIDQLRKEIGMATKGKGVFRNVETGLNKALYARLTSDQDAIARSVQGGSDISDAAKGLIRQRKQLEDNLVSLLGDDLNKALNTTVSGVIKGLGNKGEIERFNQVMMAIPKHKRGEVALSAMNDVFKGAGVNQTALSPTSFTKWYNNINRSPAAKKALFDVLPKDSKKAIDNLYTVSNGISRALGQTIPTGRINSLFNPDTGFIRKMVGKTVGPAISFAIGSPVASAATNATVNFLKQTTDGAKRASDLMGSPEFQNIIRQAVKEGVIEGGQISTKLINAEKRLEKSKKYKKWADTLGEKDRAALSGGLLTYLFSDLAKTSADSEQDKTQP